jgi:hypothetical protein
LTDLSDADRAILDQGKSYQTANVSIESWLSDLSSLNEAASDLRQTIADDLRAAPEPPEAPHGKTLKDASSEYVRNERSG